MTYRNDVTYTILDAKRGAHVEHTATLYRERCLTPKGAQRLIRKDLPSVTVIRVQHASVSA